MEENKKSAEEMTDDWLLSKDSNFIKEYWKKHNEVFKRNARRLDARFKLEDAVSVAAELGDVDTLEHLLDSMKSDKEMIGC